MKKNEIFLGILLLAVMVPSYAEVKNVTLKYEHPKKKAKKRMAKQALKKNSSCSFSVSDFTDARQNKQTVANKFGGSLQPTNLPSWLNSVRESASKNTQRESADIKIIAKPTLLRLYTYNESLNINAVNAVQVNFEVAGKTIISKHYRGFYGKTNWANGDGEHLTALNLSINNFIERYKKDLNSICDKIVSKV